MDINKLRFFKIPVQEEIKMTIISNNASKIRRSSMVTVNQKENLIALIDDELWLLPNHRALRDVFGKYGAGTIIKVYRRNKGSYKHKLPVKYHFKMVKEVSNKKAKQMINEYGDDKALKMIINGMFYKKLDKDYQEPTVMSLF